MERTALMELAATPKGSLGVGQVGMSMVCDEGFNTVALLRGWRKLQHWGTAACRARWGWCEYGKRGRSAAVTRVSVGQAVVVPCDCVRDETDVLLLLCFCFCFGFCCCGFCCCLGFSFAAAAPAAAAAAVAAFPRVPTSRCSAKVSTRCAQELLDPMRASGWCPSSVG